MFVFTMYVMLLTLDEFTPTIQERLRTPGLMIRPTGDQLELRFSPENPETWSHYVRSLDAFLELRKVILLKMLVFIGQVRNHPKRSCQFNRTVLDECSGLHDPSYGYQSGQPCIFLKLNRFVNVTVNQDLAVECVVVSNTLTPGGERDKFAGRVSFKLRVSD
ncbi:hypothetical protein CRUP_005279, partial [Coryphaenoides rupestris]